MADSDLIAQFCSITGADAKQADGYLKVSDNNLQQAISLFFEGGPLNFEDPTSTTISSREGSSTPQTDQNLFQRLQEEEYSRGLEQIESDEVRQPIAPVTERLVDPGYNWGENNIDQFRSIGRNAGIFNQQLPSRLSSRIQRDDSDDDDAAYDDADSDILEESIGTPHLSSHQSRLASLFRPPFDIISKWGLERAKTEGVTREQWIMVDIQNSQEFQCQVLNRDLWSNTEVKNVIKNNFIFLQFPHDSPAGIEYLQYYPFNDEYPHISILDPRTGEQMKVWNKPVSSSQWLMEIYDFLGKYSLQPGHRNPPADVPKTRRNPDHMTEEEQIEMAVRQSLGHKEEEDDDDDELEVTGVETVKATTEPESSKSSKSNIDDDEDWESLTAEEKLLAIMADDCPEPTDPATSTRIQIRLGTGKRVVRRFDLKDKVTKIYAVVKAIMPEVKGHYFVLTLAGENLMSKFNETIQNAQLQSSALMLEILE